MTVICHFELHGPPNAPESGETVEVEIDAPVTLNKVRHAFPFVGDFYFRQKIAALNHGYEWFDLTNPEAEIRVPSVPGQTQHLFVQVGSSFYVSLIRC